jgi:hypothetical protein
VRIQKEIPKMFVYIALPTISSSVVAAVLLLRARKSMRMVPAVVRSSHRRR